MWDLSTLEIMSIILTVLKNIKQSKMKQQSSYSLQRKMNKNIQNFIVQKPVLWKYQWFILLLMIFCSVFQNEYMEIQCRNFCYQIMVICQVEQMLDNFCGSYINNQKFYCAFRLIKIFHNKHLLQGYHQIREIRISGNEKSLSGKMRGGYKIGIYQVKSGYSHGSF